MMKRTDEMVVGPIDTVKVSPFDVLPNKARKRRRVAKPIEGDPPVPTTQSGTALYHVPGGGTGIGIACLDPLVLGGSQRIGIIGLPGTGKSTCCKSLLSDLAGNYPVISVFSGSEADNPFYSLCIPKLFIQTRITRRGLKQFINRQRLAINHDSPLKDALLILDDCFESPSSLDNDMPFPLFSLQTRETVRCEYCINRVAIYVHRCGVCSNTLWI